MVSKGCSPIDSMMPDPELGRYAPRRMLSAAHEEVPHLNGYRLSLGVFPPGTQIQVAETSIGETIRRAWKVLGSEDYQIADQRPPILPVTHGWITDSTPHGTLLAERDIAIVPSGFFQGKQYSSNAILLTLDADDAAVSRPEMSVDSPLAHRVVIQGGRVHSHFVRGKHHIWRTIDRVEPQPATRTTIDLLAKSISARSPLPA